MITNVTTTDKIQTDTFKIYDFQAFKQKALAWANLENIVCFLDNNGYENYPYHSQECLLAVGAKDELTTTSNSFTALKKFYEEKKENLNNSISEETNSTGTDPTRASPMASTQSSSRYLYNSTNISSCLTNSRLSDSLTESLTESSTCSSSSVSSHSEFSDREMTSICA